MSAIHKAILSLPFDGGIVLLDERRDRLFAYNESASLVWRALEEGPSPAKSLAEAYGICLSQAQRDADAIIAHWRGQDLMADVPSDRAPAPQPAAPALPQQGPLSRNCYDIGGYSFAVSTTDSRIATTLDGVLGHQNCAERQSTTLISVAASDGELSLAVNGYERLRSSEIGEITGGIFQTMLEIVHGVRDWLAIIHGAAVLGSDGALVLAGPSGSGKSTFAAYMTALGYGYAADDMAALLPDGRLAPWPVARSLKSGSWDALRDVFPGFDDAPAGKKGATDVKYLVPPGSAWAEAPRKVQAILFPRFSEHAATGVTALRPMEALQLLLQDRLWLGYPLTAAAVRAFLAWLEQIQAFSICYSDMHEAGVLVRTNFP